MPLIPYRLLFITLCSASLLACDLFDILDDGHSSIQVSGDTTLTFTGEASYRDDYILSLTGIGGERQAVYAYFSIEGAEENWGAFPSRKGSYPIGASEDSIPDGEESRTATLSLGMDSEEERLYASTTGVLDVERASVDERSGRLRFRALYMIRPGVYDSTRAVDVDVTFRAVGR